MIMSYVDCPNGSLYLMNKDREIIILNNTFVDAEKARYNPTASFPRLLEIPGTPRETVEMLDSPKATRSTILKKTFKSLYRTIRMYRKFMESEWGSDRTTKMLERIGTMERGIVGNLEKLDRDSIQNYLHSRNQIPQTA